MRTVVPNAGYAAASHSIGVIVDREGTRGCDHAVAIGRDDRPIRDLSDAVHAFCAVHGASPSVVGRALDANGFDPIAPWLQQASAAFDQERQLLAMLTAAVGPIPSTPRHAQAEAVINGQRHALATLASSDRAGCAVGAALALLLDWHAIRKVLARAAHRFDVLLLSSDLPARSSILDVAAVIAAHSAHARALAFGAEQLALQHRGLWQLLEARAEARDAT